MGRAAKVTREDLERLAPTHTVKQAARALGVSIVNVYAAEKRHGIKCSRQVATSSGAASTRSQIPEDYKGDPNNIPDHLCEHVRRMYDVGHPPGAIAALRGLKRLDVCAFLGVPQ